MVAVGSSSGDSEMKQYKTKTLSGISAPSGAAKADVWIVANIGRPWTSGVAQFDDFAVTAPAAPFLSARLIWLGSLASLLVLLFGTRILWRSRKPSAHAPASNPAQRTPA
jgi:hypothetical protein